MSLDSLLRATGKNLLPNPNVHAYNYSSDYKKYNNTDEIFLTAGTYSVSVSANCPALQFWNVTTKQQYTVNEAVSAYSTNTYYKIYDGFALGRASDAVRQMWFTLKINALITLNSGNTNGTSQECQIEKGSTATTYEPYEYLGPKTINLGNSKNLFDKDAARRGYEITNASTGQISPSANWFVTDYIHISPNTTYVVSGATRGANVLFYDKNKTFISTVQYSANYTVTVPDNSEIYYLILNSVLTDIDNFQLEKGSTATAYQPYKYEVLKVSYNSRNLFNKALPLADINVTATAIRQGYRIPVNAGTYTVSGGSNVTFCKTLTGDTYGPYHSLENAVTLTLNTKGYILIYSVGSEPITAIVDTLQLELGNKATEYVSYFSTVVWIYKQ